MKISSRETHMSDTNNNNNNNRAALHEDDQVLLLFLFLSLTLSVLLPCILAISPRLLADGPILLSIILLLVMGPAFHITIKEARFLLSGLLTTSLYFCHVLFSAASKITYIV